VSNEWQVPQGYEHGYQWGAHPPPGYEPVYLAPRPPRPGTVNLALTLTYIGVGVATVDFLLNVALSWLNRSSLSGSGSPFGTVGVMTVFVVASVLGWLLPAAGTVACAILARRGANPARIVLASLMGLFALINLCQTVAGTVSVGALMASRTPGLTGESWIHAGVSLIQFGLAVTIGVLLLVPSAQRYFSPGPGRRFAPAGAAVPSIHDRP
jgi:hypothetical protein